MFLALAAIVLAAIVLAAIVLAAVSQIAQTMPATSLTKPTTSDVTIAAGFPIRTLDIIRNTTTGTHDGTIRGRSGAANPATLLLCPEINCAPTCNEFALNSLAEDECFLTNVQALSVAIS